MRILPKREEVRVKVWTSILYIAGGIAGLILILYLFQRHLIYFPRAYDSTYDLKKFENVVELDYETAEGRQVSFYIPPRQKSNSLPDELWFVFGGNAALALDFYDFVYRYPNQSAGILLIEYPGYGKCEGKASPASILASTETAMDRLAQHLSVERGLLEEKLHILGHSLGSGAGLQFAVRHPAQKIILISPFTSLQEMACRSVGKPLCYLLRHHFDNISRLSELAKRDPMPQVHIIHGTRDQVVPVAMGQLLAKNFSSMVTYLEIPHADHNFIFSLAGEEIYQAMGGPQAPSMM